MLTTNLKLLTPPLTANGQKFLPSAFSSLFTKVKMFAVTVNKRFFLFFYWIDFKDLRKSEQTQSSFLPFVFAVNVMLKLTYP